MSPNPLKRPTFASGTTLALALARAVYELVGSRVVRLDATQFARLVLRFSQGHGFAGHFYVYVGSMFGPDCPHFRTVLARARHERLLEHPPASSIKHHVYDFGRFDLSDRPEVQERVEASGIDWPATLEFMRAYLESVGERLDAASDVRQEGA